MTVADAGSFSAAGRKLLRAQSVISQTVANLEAQIGFALFDRTGRYPKVTDQGLALLADARAILASIEGFRAKAKGISGGLEPELSVVVDVMFPISAIATVAHDFARTFPATPLRLHVEALGAVAQSVIAGVCQIGVVGSLPEAPDSLRQERLIGMLMVMVAAPSHPLAALGRLLSKADLARYTQIILTDHTTLSAGRSFGVYSPNTWKFTDMGAKHAFLRAGLGWGGMPMAAVEADLAAGDLVRLRLEDDPPGGSILPISVVYAPASPPGPAGRWFIESLRACAGAYDTGAGVKSSRRPSVGRR